MQTYGLASSQRIHYFRVFFSFYYIVPVDCVSFLHNTSPFGAISDAVYLANGSLMQWLVVCELLQQAAVNFSFDRKLNATAYGHLASQFELLRHDISNPNLIRSNYVWFGITCHSIAKYGTYVWQAASRHHGSDGTRANVSHFPCDKFGNQCSQHARSNTECGTKRVYCGLLSICDSQNRTRECVMAESCYFLICPCVFIQPFDDLRN